MLASVRASFGNIRHNIKVVLIPFGLLAAHKQLLFFWRPTQPTNPPTDQPTNQPTNAAGVAVRVKLRFG
jgi:hypothetical protein